MLQEDFHLAEAFATEKRLLLLTGFYPKPPGAAGGALYHLGRLLNVSITALQFLSMMAQVHADRKDFSRLMAVLCLLMTHVTFMWKAGNFFWHHAGLLQVERHLGHPVFYGFGSARLEATRRELQISARFANYFRVTCLAGIAFISLSPLLDSDRKGALPMPGRVPFDVASVWAYYPTALFQISSIFISAYNNSCIDILNWMLIRIATAQFDLLKQNLREMRYCSSSTNGPMAIKQVERGLKGCIKHHQEILRLVTETSAIFSRGTFLQFLSSIIIICVTCFQLLVLVPVHSLGFAFLTVYLVCMLYQVAMYCWYGHGIMVTSDEVVDHFYMSNWYESDIKLRKTMMVLLENTKRPVVLTAGGLVPLSLDTLTSILRSSYSYLAVLQRLYTEE